MLQDLWVKYNDYVVSRFLFWWSVHDRVGEGLAQSMGDSEAPDLALPPPPEREERERAGRYRGFHRDPTQLPSQGEGALGVEARLHGERHD